MRNKWVPLPRYVLRKKLVLHVLKKRMRENQSCLEVGYGPGDMLIELSRLGFSTHGYDFSINAYNEAQKRINQCALQIKRNIHLFFNEKEIGKAQYDVVLALEVLEHVKDDVSMLKVFNRYLKKNGLLIFSVPAHKSKWGENDVWAGHYRRYEKNDFFQKLPNAKFEILHVWSYGYPLTLLLDLLIHRSHKKEIIANFGISKEYLTKQSGITREKNFANQIAAWSIWTYPFIYVQRLFLDFDMSSAFLVIARKLG